MFPCRAQLAKILSPTCIPLVANQREVLISIYSRKSDLKTKPAPVNTAPGNPSSFFRGEKSSLNIKFGGRDC